MSIAVCFAVMAFTLIMGLLKGARIGMWTGWVLALVLAPAWMIQWVGPLSFDPRMAAAIAGLILIFTSKEEIRFRLTLMDLFFIGYFLVHVISQQVNDDLTAGNIFAFVRRWTLPYLIGRFFIARHQDLDKLTPIFAGFLLLCSCMAIVDSITHRNWMNSILGKNFFMLDHTSEGFRWGLKRAHGNTEHPIYFGLMLVMLFPWAIEAGRAAWKNQGPKWWLFVPWITFAAIVATVSRGAQIGSIVCLCVSFFFRNPKWRVFIIIGAIVLGVGNETIQEKGMDVLAKAAQETGDDETWVSINGKEYLYTGTRHRMLLFVAYERGVREAGMFGYGAAMEDVPVYNDASVRFSSIDCHYLVLLLQHGWAGIFVFCGMLMLAIFYGGWAAWRCDHWSAKITGAMTGSMIAVGMLMFSVFFHPHYGSVFMFGCGFLACVRSMPSFSYISDGDGMLDVEAADKNSEFQPPSQKRLRPGHAPVRSN